MYCGKQYQICTSQYDIHRMKDKDQKEHDIDHTLYRQYLENFETTSISTTDILPRRRQVSLTIFSTAL